MVFDFDKRIIVWDEIQMNMAAQDLAATSITTKQVILDANYDMPKLEAMVPDHLHPEEQLQLLQLIRRYHGVFEGQSAVPFAARPYPIPEIHLAATKREINRLVSVGVLEPTKTSPWGSPTFITPKKDGTVRLVSDFRRLNKMIERHPFSLPNIQHIMRSMTKPMFKTAFDLVMGYYARVLDHGSRDCTAIVLPFGKYRYCRLPMGIVSAPDEFQAVMNLIVGDLDFVKCYLDDLLVVSNSFSEHLEHLDIVLSRFLQYGMVVNGRKTFFCAKTLDYLGFHITDDGICPMNNKVEAILRLSEPKTRRELRRFVGMVNYYRDLWPRRAHLCAPLTALTSDKQPFKWSEEAIRAFIAIKAMIAREAMLVYPDSAYLSSFTLMHRNINLRNYASNKLELLAIKEVLSEFRNVLLGRDITIYTDHLNFTHETFNEPTLLRWRLKIEEFAPRFVYLKGENNIVADALSRLKTNEDSDVMGAIFDLNSDELFCLDLKTIHHYQQQDDGLSAANNKEISGYDLKVSSKGQILIPPPLRRPIITTYHEWLVHPGATLLKATIRQVFRWPRMEPEIDQFVNSCDTCKQKYPTKKYGLIPPKMITTQPWAEIAEDLIGPFGSQKFRAITIIDTATRLLEMAPILTPDSYQAAKLIDQLWFCRYPRPQRCVFDQGSEFKLEFLEMLKCYGITPVPTTSKNPTANSIIERIHLVIGNKMRLEQITNADEWEEFCSTCIFATRATFHSTLQTSPGALTFGRNMLFDFANTTNVITAHKRHVTKMLKDNLRENKNRIPHEYVPGDMVRINLSADKDKRSKMSPATTGPFKVVATRPNGTVTIDRGKFLELINIRRLLPVK
ncbi:hypothetical protein Ae201684P_006697 [Aphanomyces euteiches]|nr:hypothetical protein Ae201684P_006697 [Aphanomyces euteiches]